MVLNFDPPRNGRPRPHDSLCEHLHVITGDRASTLPDLGVVDQRLLPFAGCQRIGEDVCGCASRGGWLQVDAKESARRVSSAEANDTRQGQRVGTRSVGVPERFTSRPGIDTKRVRSVRATRGR